MPKNLPAIIWNNHTHRYEVWYESREVAHSESLLTAKNAFPTAVVSSEALRHHRKVESALAPGT